MLDGIDDRPEARMKMFGRRLSHRRELDPAIAASKKFDTQVFLEGLQLVADGRRGDMQLLGSLTKAQVAGGRLEGTQRV
jgi:hypothetical protein